MFEILVDTGKRSRLRFTADTRTVDTQGGLDVTDDVRECDRQEWVEKSARWC